MARTKKPTDVLRQAILSCGRSRYQLSLESGVDQGALSRFIHGHRDLVGESIDKLAEALGLELVAKERGRK